MISELLRVPAGPVDLSAIDSHGQPGFEGKKKDGKKALPGLGDELADLQEKLFAEGYTGGSRRVLLVLQGMDTSGKGGVLSHTVSMLNVSGLALKSFKKPTEEELAHDFLWRVEKVLPAAGEIGIFDRSHYEDVLVVKVHELAKPDEIERRYGAINDFEKRLADEGTSIIKCMLHISPDEQRQRLLARLDDPTKRWKFDAGDLAEREHWEQYMAAYQDALAKCDTDAAPWYVVPADRKWYRNWAVQQLLLETLRGLDPQYPKREDLDVPALKRELG
jgi:PPK2 family polyphosphate:nucleotide phosphotransferase